MLTIALAVFIMAVPLWAQSEDDFEVSQNRDNTITITGYKGTARAVVIPETLWGLRVTAIGDRAFYGKNLTSVVIPNSVITIGSSAFAGGRTITNVDGSISNGTPNRITSVTLGNSVTTIGDGAFSGNLLTEVVIPDSVTSIGRYAFTQNNLRRVTFGSGLQTIGSSAFAGGGVTSDYDRYGSDRPQQVSGAATGNQLTEVNLAATSLQTISNSVFKDNQISIFTLPASLRRIDNEAFGNNQIKSLTIPNGVTRVVPGAFSGNPIETLVIPASLAGRQHGRREWSLPDNSDQGSRSPAFPAENLVSITLPANMQDEVIRLHFGDAFLNFWISQEKAAGVYARRGPIWTREAPPQAAAPAPAPAATARTTTPAAASTPATPISADSNLPVNWRTIVEGGNAALQSGTSANFSTGRETIQRAERDVLIFEVTLARGNEWRFGQFNLEDDALIQRLKTANGVRFKVQGDGGAGWKVLIPTTDTASDNCFHESSFTTRNNNVVNVDIQFSRLRQPSWGRRVNFNKSNITAFAIQRQTDSSSVSGSSTIKVFDFEIY